MFGAHTTGAVLSGLRKMEAAHNRKQQITICSMNSFITHGKFYRMCLERPSVSGKENTRLQKAPKQCLKKTGTDVCFGQFAVADRPSNTSKVCLTEATPERARHMAERPRLESRHCITHGEVLLLRAETRRCFGAGAWPQGTLATGDPQARVFKMLSTSLTVTHTYRIT